MAEKKILKVKCPTCKKKAVYSKENFSRPFCSERCRLIDLSQWFEEDYSIAGDDSFSIDDSYEKE
jgi:endogenous inhibitor of DNA gyrase (YacG/DUF329 family)